MFRRLSSVLRIGTAEVSPPTLSVIKDPTYLQHRLALLGKKPYEIRRDNNGAMNAAAAASPPPLPHDNTTFAPLAPEQIQRFTTSLGSAEQLFNKQAGAIPTNVVDEATGRVIGSTQLNPTRYGDWEQHGRCCDF